MRQGGGKSCTNDNEHKFVAPVRERREFTTSEDKLNGKWDNPGVYIVTSSGHGWMVYMADRDWWFICQASEAWADLLTGGVWFVPGIDEIERIINGGMHAVAALRVEGKLT